MKQFIKFVLAVAVIVACVPHAKAALGFDTFNPNRGFVLTPYPVACTTIGTALYTNGPIDTLHLTGIGFLDFVTITNAGAGNTVITATIYTAPDQTNYVQYTNFAVGSLNTVVVTNTYYGSTNLLCTNSIIAPGIYPVTPNAATAGFATPYLVYNPATNQTVTLSGNQPIWAQINLDDINRYIRVVYAISGGTGATNAYVSTTLIGPQNVPGY